MASVAGCGPDLTKQNFPPTKVAPKPGSGATEPAPKGPIHEPALAPAKIRTVDACKLLGAQTLKGIGAPAGQPYADDNSQCTVPITDTTNRRITLTMTIGDTMPDASEQPTAGLEGLPMQEHTYDRSCSIEVATSQKPDLGIRMNAMVDNGAAPCVDGRKITAKVIDRLRKNPPKVRVAKGSLVDVDPCKVVDPKVLKTLTDASFTKTAAGLHTCEVNGDGPLINVGFDFGYPPESSGDTVQLTPSIKATVESRSNSGCQVQWIHRKVDSEHAESVDIDYSQYVDAPKGDTLCKNATALARSIVKKLPEK